MVGERHRIRTVDRELALADHVHEFDAGALDDDLLAAAERYTGFEEKSALVREAIRALIERECIRRLRRWAVRSLT